MYCNGLRNWWHRQAKGIQATVLLHQTTHARTRTTDFGIGITKVASVQKMSSLTVWIHFIFSFCYKKLVYEILLWCHVFVMQLKGQLDNWFVFAFFKKNFVLSCTLVICIFFIVIFIYYSNILNFEEEANLQNFSLAEFELPCVSGRPR